MKSKSWDMVSAALAAITFLCFALAACNTVVPPGSTLTKATIAACEQSVVLGATADALAVGRPGWPEKIADVRATLAPICSGPVTEDPLVLEGRALAQLVILVNLLSPPPPHPIVKPSEQIAK